MSLLKEIDIQTRLQPLKSYLDDLAELGIDPNEEIVMPNIYKIAMEACGMDEDTPLEEARESEFRASQELMRGRGVLDDEMRKRKEMLNRSRLENPRLGLQAHEPSKGDRVKLGGGGGIGRVLGMKGDAVFVQNKRGYQDEIPRHMLKGHAIRNPKSGENEIVWIEEM